MYPTTPDRRQSKTFLTIDERHRRQGIWTPPLLLKNHKNIGFPKQYWSGSPEQSQSYKCTKPAFNVGACGVSLADRWWPAYCGIWILSSPLINLKKVSKLDPPGSAHERRSKIARNSVFDCHSLATNCNLKLCH